MTRWLLMALGASLLVLVVMVIRLDSQGSTIVSQGRTIDSMTIQIEDFKAKVKARDKAAIQNKKDREKIAVELSLTQKRLNNVIKDGVCYSEPLSDDASRMLNEIYRGSTK